MPLVQGPILRTSDPGHSRLCPTRRSLEARPELAVLGQVAPRGGGLPSSPGSQDTREGPARPQAPLQASPPGWLPPAWPRAPALRRPLHPALFAFLEPASAWAAGMSMRAGLARSCWRALGSRPPGLGATVSTQSSLSGLVTHTSSRIPGNAFLLLSLMLFSCLMRSSLQNSMATSGWGGRRRKWTNPFPRRAPQIPISHTTTLTHTHTCTHTSILLPALA